MDYNDIRMQLVTLKSLEGLTRTNTVGENIKVQQVTVIMIIVKKIMVQKKLAREDSSSIKKRLMRIRHLMISMLKGKK